jgi:CopA family copper-resistance protein
MARQKFDYERRKFINSVLAGGVFVSGLTRIVPVYSQLPGNNLNPSDSRPRTEFDLTIAETPVNFTGTTRIATTINGSVPAPTLRWREGDTVTIRVTNRLNVDTSIHWHGILLPYQMDGVPGISYKGISPGETFVYQFTVSQSGTYWYHSHSGFQEQTGMYGAIIIEPRSGESIRTDRDYIVQFSDWTDEDPIKIIAKLKKHSDYYNFNQPTAKDFFRDVTAYGMNTALEMRKMWNQMRMNPTDLADISGYSYTYLTNGITPQGNWTGIFHPGEKVRLRFINSGAMTFFDVRIPGLKMTVVQTDGQNVEPVTVDEIRIGVAETYDVIVTPVDDVYTIFAQSMDRTGYARATLAVRNGLSTTIPALDKPEPLTMGDMMGSMSNGDMQGMNHGGMEMDHSAHNMGSTIQVRHARTEYGPSVDMRVDNPRTNLDDPGVGLRNNGRHVLTYADLHTIGGPINSRSADREIELHLTGNMERYTWSFDGLEFGKSTPVHFPYGENIRVILVNDTMMTHPMHLHGMWGELESPEGHFQVRKHVISVQPAQRTSFIVPVDAKGRWAWHCHLLYHMDAGMFREVVVA